MACWQAFSEEGNVPALPRLVAHRPQSDLFLAPSGCLSRIRLIYWRNPRSESAIRSLTEFPARLP